MSGLSEKHLAWFEDERRIPAEVATRFGTYTARWDDKNKQPVADPSGDWIVFPYVEHGDVVAAHCRTAIGKEFLQRAGGKKTFFNSDVLDDPALETGQMELVITEGEPDALTAIACGYPLTVSVPDGAPPVPKGKKPDDLDPIEEGAEQTGKFEYLWNNRERLKRIKRFIIAVDNDPVGQRLDAELVRRLLPSRCMFVTYPDGCKDLNAVLVKHGEAAVAAVLNGAKPYPVRGLYRMSDYPKAQKLQLYSMGWELIDPHMKLYFGELVIITGIPSHGKSAWVIHLLCNLARLHGWRSALFSPEMPTQPHLYDILRRIIGGPNADAEIEDKFRFIGADPTGQEDDEDFDLNWIIEKATDAVLRDGIRVLVIDPWNQVEHARTKGESMVDYIGRSLRALARFARLYQCIVIVVAHPTKDVVANAKDGKPRTPTPYDIDGAAHWFNRADHCVIVERPDPRKDVGAIIVAKSRFYEAGQRGRVMMKYDRATSRFMKLDEVPENSEDTRLDY
jgi:twinkle protein